MTRRAYIHIGMQKCGSTSIQSAFSNAREPLREMGLLFPSGDHAELIGTLHQVGTRHFFYANRGYDPGAAERMAVAYREQVEAEIASYPGSILISSEYLNNLRLDKIEYAIRWLGGMGFQVEIICFVRHPLALAQSSVAQDVKMGVIDLWDDLAKVRLPSPMYSLLPYTEALPENQIHVIDFDRSLERGLSASVLDVMGMSDLSGLLIEQKENPSLSMAGVLLADRMNKAQATDNGFPKNRRFLFGVGGRKFALPHTAARKILDLKQQEIRWLSDTFGLDLKMPDIREDDAIGIDDEAMTDIVRMLARVTHV